MLAHRFSCSESSRNCGCSAFRQREHSIHDTLSRHKRNSCRITVMHRPWHTDRPFLHHGEFFSLPFCCLDHNKCIIDMILSVRYDTDHDSFHIRRNHTFVHDRMRLRNFCNDCPSLECVTFCNRHVCIPQFIKIQRIYTDTSCNKCAITCLRNLFQRTFNSVENIIDNSRCEDNRYCISGTLHNLSRLQTGSLLIDLNRCPVLVQRNNLSYQTFFSYIDHLGHLKSGPAFQINDRAVNSIYFSSMFSVHCPYLLQMRTSDILSPARP